MSNNEVMPMNNFGGVPALQPQSTQAMAAVAREAQEMQAAVFMARQFPRDPGRCLQMIEGDCQRVSFAEKAMYEYPKGGQTVTGPSIRMAEVLAQRWGNIDTGWKITDRSRQDETGCIAWAWDLETNYRKRIEFVVEHRIKARGVDKILTDEREIYELIANKASRRQRNAILAVIPGDVQEAAILKAKETMEKKGDINQMRTQIVADLAKHGVQNAAIEKRIGKKISAMTGVQCVQLRNIINSLNDGSSKVADWFDDILNPEKVTQEQKQAHKAPPMEHEKRAANDEQAKAYAEFDRAAQEYETNGGHVANALPQVNLETIKDMEAGRIRAATNILTDLMRKGIYK